MFILILINFPTRYSSFQAYAAVAVKALIDAGSCPDVSTGELCGNDAVGYYNTGALLQLSRNM